jgi:hypothetical protein
MIVAYPEAAVLSDRSVRVPTLNEMISACGADITYIVRTGRGWSANGDNGETVTEAVARRWMSLHRNDRSRCSPTDITDSSLLWSEELADCSTQTHP